MKKILSKIRILRSAFSLIETIIAITVIALVITASATLTQGSLRISRTTMSQLIATHLAEQGLEIVRNVRDSNWLQNRKWRDQFATPGMYIISSGGTPYHMELISSDAAAESISLTKSEKFHRYLDVTDLPDGSVRIVSTVTYSDNTGPKKTALTMELTNWKKGPL